EWDEREERGREGKGTFAVNKSNRKAKTQINGTIPTQRFRADPFSGGTACPRPAVYCSPWQRRVETRSGAEGSAVRRGRGGAERGAELPPPCRASWSSPTAARAGRGSSVFRLGNVVHALVAAKKTTELPEVLPRICLTASNLSRALYFFCDTVLWLKSVGLQSDFNKAKWQNWATKCYYFSLLMNLARDWYEVLWRLEQATQEEKMKENCFWDERHQHLSSPKCNGLHGFLFLLFQILRNHPPLLLDVVKNLCDLTGPLDTLGIYKTNPGVVGFCGLLSSLVGILTLASPHLKLKE
uniref:Peroxisomal biosis factor 11 alpha n=1 Tax=Coturnix japonica TaxID=93934 RepID=A0A8C2UGA9_COTJA